MAPMRRAPTGNPVGMNVRLAFAFGVLLTLCGAIRLPEDGPPLPFVDGISTPAEPNSQSEEGVLTVIPGKVKPPPSERVPNLPAQPSRRTDCLTLSRRKRAATHLKVTQTEDAVITDIVHTNTKPVPVRQVLRQPSQTSRFICPAHWRGLDLTDPNVLECPVNATGFYPFPPDCRKYLNCWRGRGMVQPCAPATFFDPIRRECDYPEKVKCLPNCYDSSKIHNPGSDLGTDQIFENVESNNGDGIANGIGVNNEQSHTNNEGFGARNPDSENPASGVVRPGGYIDLSNNNQATVTDDFVADPNSYVNPTDPNGHSPLLDVRDLPKGKVSRVRPNATPKRQGASQTDEKKARTRRYAYTSTPSKYCPMEGGSGLAPDPNDCSRFYNCDHGRGYLQDCADGTLFSERIGSCDFDYLVNCGSRPRKGANGRGASALGAKSDSFSSGSIRHEVQVQNPYGPSYPVPSGRQYQHPPRNPDSSYRPPINQYTTTPRAVFFQPQLHPQHPNYQRPNHGPYSHSHNHQNPTQGQESTMPYPHYTHIHNHPPSLPPNSPYFQHLPEYHRNQPPNSPYIPHNSPPSNPPQNHNHQHHPSQTQPSFNTAHNHPQYQPSLNTAHNHPQYQPSSNTAHNHPQHQPSFNTALNPAYQPNNLPPNYPTFTPKRDNERPVFVVAKPVPLPQPEPTPRFGQPDDQSPEGTDAIGAIRPNPNSLGNRGTEKGKQGPKPDQMKPETYPSLYPQGREITPQTTPEPEDPCPEEGPIEGQADRDTWVDLVNKTRNVRMPFSGQWVRLRGGRSYREGFVEVLGPGGVWGGVCDAEGGWNIDKASVVCKQLGFEKGAESAWQGGPISSKPTHVDSVTCGDGAPSLLHCSLQRGWSEYSCDTSTRAVSVRCLPNWTSKCQPGETVRGDRCYRLFKPTQEMADLAHSSSEAVEHCRSRGGHIIDINSQAENDFLTDWLATEHPDVDAVLTSGLGVRVRDSARDLWIWQTDNYAPMGYSKWWPGWTNGTGIPPDTGDRTLCLLLKKTYPCEGRRFGETCSADYMFWNAVDCAQTGQLYPYICERKGDDIGCVDGTEKEYQGTANVTTSGRACLPWDDPRVVSELRNRTFERIQKAALSGHNYCRKVSGNREPWCYVAYGQDRGVRVEDCHIPPCWDRVVSRSVRCAPQQFSCGLSECIPMTWKCDGERDCSSGLDEENCIDYLKEFRTIEGGRQETHFREKWLHLDMNTCARRCIESTDFFCKSFSYKSSLKECYLSATSTGEIGNFVKDKTNEWSYHELKSVAINCDQPDKGLFKCDNRKCINITDVCNGKNDCGDRSDEVDCPSEKDIGYEIRLTGGKETHEGFVQVKVRGTWGAVCDDGFGLKEATVICHELGFSGGAVEKIKPFSLPSPPPSLEFVVDNLQCSGNETSLRFCDHNGWFNHDCKGVGEMVAVRCVSEKNIICDVAPHPIGPTSVGGISWGSMIMTVAGNCRPKDSCPEEEWRCKSGGCIRANFVCDSRPDCEDQSDEDDTLCGLPFGARLVGGSQNSSSGRLEVQIYGEWGTVCDDDFNVEAAIVACRSVGKPGDAVFRKEAFFGKGKGIIWLDQVRCNGNESSLTDCVKVETLAETDCNHDEDVGVECLGGGEKAAQLALMRTKVDHQSQPIDWLKYLGKECGRRIHEMEMMPTVRLARVLYGSNTPRGSFPWQASLRIRSSIKDSIHWCGAVLIGPYFALSSAHCLDYTKNAYVLRVGDHDPDDEDGTEQEVNLEDIFLHEDFKKQTLENDIALLVLQKPIRINDAVQPICLPSSSASYTPGRNCSISGWGSVGTSNQGYSRVLRSASLPLLPTRLCADPKVYGTRIKAGMFCAGHLKGGPDACQGDSGGPMACSENGRHTLYGLTSWGHGCGMANKPGVYTNVTHYRPWIFEKMRLTILSGLATENEVK